MKVASLYLGAAGDGTVLRTGAAAGAGRDAGDLAAEGCVNGRGPEPRERSEYAGDDFPYWLR